MGNVTLRKQVSALLVGEGFRRHGRMHVRRVDSSISYWVDTGPLGSQEDIAPFAGLRHDQVENLLADFLGLPRDKIVGTVGANVGYILSGEYRSWVPPYNPTKVFSDILKALERLKPFMVLDRLSEVYQIEGARDPLWRFRQIILYLLLHRVDEANQIIEATRTIECAHHEELCDQFRKFEQRARAWLQSEGL